MSEQDSQGRTWLCSVVFLDIVSYTGKPVAQQIEMKQHLQGTVSGAVTHIAEQDRIMVDTGDGAALCFFGDPEEALFVAVNIRAATLSDAGLIATPYGLRIGINLGPVKVVRSISGQRNPLGDGINNAQRVMSFAQPNQILVARSFYDVVSCLSQEYAQIFQHLGIRRDKHVKEHDLYEVRLPGESATAALPASNGEGGSADWDALILSQVSAELAAYVGPMARVLVKKASQDVTDLDALYSTLALSIPLGSDRKTFLERRRTVDQAFQTEPPTGDAKTAPSAGNAGFSRDPEQLAHLERCLAQHIGPLAGILVKKALQKADNEGALISMLVDELESDTEKKAFLDAVSRNIHG